MKDFQATGEASSFQKKHPAPQKFVFSSFVGHFCAPGSGSALRNADLDPDPADENQ
jgi:hypothetical protein